MRIRASRRGFTLLEMSLVIAIIGLIIGSIVIGRDLFITARDRSVIKEIEQYKQAVQAFQTKYSALPGDMINPAQYWPSQIWSGNGNGDGIILWSHEGPEAWLQMQLAGFLPGNTNISTACTTNCVAQPGVNIPSSYSIDHAGWSIGVQQHTGENILLFGGYHQNNSGTNSLGSGPVLPTKEAFYIDSKLDDGDPISGNLRARGTCHYTVNCVSTANHHAYDLTAQGDACSFDVAIGQ
jgi:prepilin-type N-terminal cleavage/methylation domain-containing protein